MVVEQMVEQMVEHSRLSLTLYAGCWDSPGYKHCIVKFRDSLQLYPHTYGGRTNVGRQHGQHTFGERLQTGCVPWLASSRLLGLGLRYLGTGGRRRAVIRSWR
jgi:hypothetical protein